MKKTLLSLSLAALAFGAAAQDYTDALLLSEHNYYGTARSMSMGNAFTALGGDLGSIGINPAGSAVNSYSQFTFTPGVSIATTGSAYNAAPGTDAPGAIQRENWPRATMPNIGFTVTIKTGNRTGLKTYTLGLVYNATNYFTDKMYTWGTNNRTSYMGYLAAMAGASGLSGEALAGNFVSDPQWWPAQIAYQTSMINETGTDFVGCAQATTAGHPVIDNLSQSYERARKGHRHDMVFNLGFNFSDRFFIGGNLAWVDMFYDTSQSFSEAASKGIDWVIEGKNDTFNQMTMSSWSTIRAAGFYAKIGVIAVPLPGLRIGAAIQTPTATLLREEWNIYGQARFKSGTYDAYPSENQFYDYRLISPFRASFGLAYAIPGLGVLSADYELADFSTTRFRERGSRAADGFTTTNNILQLFTGVQHNLRVGAELKVFPTIVLRAGYNLKTSAECYRIDNAGKRVDPYDYSARFTDKSISDSDFNSWQATLTRTEALPAYTHAISGGFGYDGGGSFFLDFALRATLRPAEYLYPYPTYAAMDSPEISRNYRLWDALLTFGWRF